jgi:hypothetical protein
MTGIPSKDAATAAIVGSFLTESVSTLGIVFPLLIGAAQVVTGQYSIGQSSSGIALGIAFHVFQTRTPVFLRPIEFVINVIGGVAALIVIKRSLPSIDLTPSIDFFDFVWIQLFCLLVTPLWFTMRLLRELIRKSVKNTEKVDFLFYQPLKESVNYNLTEPEPAPSAGDVNMFEIISSVGFMTLLVVLLAGTRILGYV